MRCYSSLSRRISLKERTLILALFVCLFSLGRLNTQAQDLCSSPNLIKWPAAKPVWKLCWVSPPQSSGPNASALELRSVYYRNHLILNRANIPILNVKYDRGGCGGPHFTYRDWLGDLEAFSANNILQPGYAEPTEPPQTACDHPGRDSGTFKGVAVEKKPDRLVLTTEVKSAWYRYVLSWTFWLDGRLEPTISFSAVDYFCTTNPHTHHAYWRFDFDLDGPDHDLIEEFNSGKWSPLDETARQKNEASGRKWRVRDMLSGSAIEIIPGSHDNPADDFAVADLWALGYDANQLDDGGATKGPTGDQPHMDKYLNGENISDGKHNVVLWYRAGVYHRGDKNLCNTVGPTLRWFQGAKKKAK